ncbi:hypothetical protein CA262_05845 [Sphingobium sp. GW456-12-10-14-TSB1]|uniref:ABC transporter permease n=1 Tax=Sphingobium sp. GW456-12-10-14-TSB1 TaxID=1987165 RepID=UPI000A36C311|nr:ABC transporter permease [Sphingobium sp. GW456-12-10-14-TSB1]OUC54440.1 hypothetical protein CA262_05845 [Sphingobium sp. GW456-12-10-14-TSB1]
MSNTPYTLACQSQGRVQHGSILSGNLRPTRVTSQWKSTQLPYVALAMVNFIVMVLVSAILFDVLPNGSIVAMMTSAFLFSLIATGMGLLASAITRTQIAAMFLAMVGTLIPAVTYGGMIDPVSSLEGVGRAIGEIYPASHMFTITRGVFNKALGFGDLVHSFWPLLVSGPVIVGLAIALLKKQES